MNGTKPSFAAVAEQKVPVSSPLPPPPSSSSSSVSVPAVSVQRRYQKALELEKQLRTFIETKGPFDPNVQILNNSIRECYEAVIVEDDQFSEQHDVEQSLWRLHYKRIEEFRAQIRKSMSSSPSPNSGHKVGLRKDPIHRILIVLRNFLLEASGFYHSLLLKIRSKHGITQDLFESPDSSNLSPDLLPNERRLDELKRCYLSCHRCLIYLGDLARYKELHRDGNPATRDWSVAARYYIKSASLWPSSGNPHNQLAVLATYVGDEMMAMYYYFRSLAAEIPFLTARDNLVLLFEKNRKHYSQLIAYSNDGNYQSSDKLVSRQFKGKSNGDKSQNHELKDSKFVDKNSEHQAVGPGATNIMERMKSFRVRFVRLNGVIFTRTSIEIFSEICSATVQELEQLLNSNYNIDSATTNVVYANFEGSCGDGSRMALHLVAMLIFTLHNVNWGPDSHQPSNFLIPHAMGAAFEVTGLLLRKCIDDMFDPLLPALLIFLEWLVQRPDLTIVMQQNGNQMSDFLLFWRNCVLLLNRVSSDGDLMSKMEEEDLSFALWEDYELQGFAPLVQTQRNLNYKGYSVYCIGSKEEKRRRKKRFLAAGVALAASFKGSGQGFLYEDKLRLFHVIADNANNNTADDIVPFTKPESSSFTRLFEVFPLPENFPNEDEEEDEVIVFQPLSKSKGGAVSPLFQEAVVSKVQDDILPNLVFSNVDTTPMGTEKFPVISVQPENTQNYPRGLPENGKIPFPFSLGEENCQKETLSVAEADLEYLSRSLLHSASGQETSIISSLPMTFPIKIPSEVGVSAITPIATERSEMKTSSKPLEEVPMIVEKHIAEWVKATDTTEIVEQCHYNAPNKPTSFVKKSTNLSPMGHRPSLLPPPGFGPLPGRQLLKGSTSTNPPSALVVKSEATIADQGLVRNGKCLLPNKSEVIILDQGLARNAKCLPPNKSEATVLDQGLVINAKSLLPNKNPTEGDNDHAWLGGFQRNSPNHRIDSSGIRSCSSNNPTLVGGEVSSLPYPGMRLVDPYAFQPNQVPPLVALQQHVRQQQWLIQKQQEQAFLQQEQLHPEQHPPPLPSWAWKPNVQDPSVS